MPAELGPARTLADTVVVGVSAITELAFSFFMCFKKQRGTGGYRTPDWLANDTDGRADHAYRRLMELWADAPSQEFSEACVLAQHTGTLLDSDLETFFARFDEACSRPTPRNLMPMEPPELREAIGRRLDLLRESPEVRREYRSILEEQWSILRPEWERGGLATARKAAMETKKRLELVDDLRQALPPNHMARKEVFWPHVERALQHSQVAILPLYFAGEGQLLLDLPGFMLIGMGLDVGEKEERRRAQAAAAAAKFKLLSDPTRVALLGAMLRHPTSISDLAERFELSQPTVSVHVKALREAGLLDAQKAGNSTLYSASGERLRAMVDQAIETVVSDAVSC